MPIRLAAAALLASSLLSGAAWAQTTAPAPDSAPAKAPVQAPATVSDAAPAATPAQPDRLSVFFDLGSATVRPQDVAVLDHASRLYTDGKPIVMILTGSTDTVGSPLQNLRLSQQRALVVLTQLVARGIPAERFQILAKGETELPVADPANTAEPRNRRVEIAWR